MLRDDLDVMRVRREQFVFHNGLSYLLRDVAVRTIVLLLIGSLILAAMIWLVNAGNIEKGRLIEIEAIYVSLTALAFIFWIAAYEQHKRGKRIYLWNTKLS